MKKYGDLKEGEYYLLREEEGAEIVCIRVVLTTNNAILIDYSVVPSIGIGKWRKKSEVFAEFIDQLTDEQAIDLAEHIREKYLKDDDENDNDDDMFEDFDDDFDPFGNFDDDDEEDDEKVKRLN